MHQLSRLYWPEHVTKGSKRTIRVRAVGALPPLIYDATFKVVALADGAVVAEPSAATVDGDEVSCLFDTTPAGIVPGKYEVWLMFSAGEEIYQWPVVVEVVD